MWDGFSVALAGWQTGAIAIAGAAIGTMLVITGITIVAAFMSVLVGGVVRDVQHRGQARDMAEEYGIRRMGSGSDVVSEPLYDDGE